jgi:ATP-binding cassette subfamily F protein 3
MARRLEKELEGLAPPPKRRELDFSWPEAPAGDRTVLSVADLRFAFPDGQRLWESLSFNIYRGEKIALVGPNGCGKSTLLKLIASRLDKESGSLALGQAVRLGYFSQHQMETLRPEGTALGEIRRLSDPRATEEELMSVLGLFLLGRDFFDRPVAALSGGEKSRLLLSCLFLARCNFLVLDEPTNHLDLESREALVEALAGFQGSLVVVAHDRYLLSSVAGQVWELTGRGLVEHPGGYASYRAVREQRKSEEEKPGEQPHALQARGEQKRLRREQAALRDQIYREQKPLQETYARQEHALEAALARQGELESLLAGPALYADPARAAALLKEFRQVQSQAEALMEELSGLEQRLAALEESKSRAVST